MRATLLLVSVLWMVRSEAPISGISSSPRTSLAWDLENLRETMSLEFATLKLEQRAQSLDLRERMLQWNEQGDLQDTMTAILAKLGSLEKVVMEGREELASLASKVDVIRSEVRLISQQKLTYQNSSWSNHWFPDFSVDGLYTRSTNEDLNPPSHSGQGDDTNFVFTIDLGAVFKIHEIRLWNSLACCSDYALGVHVYAGETLVGAVSDVRKKYEFIVRGDVRSRSIFLKQTLVKYMTFLEVQVWGSGPFLQHEI